MQHGSAHVFTGNSTVPSSVSLLSMYRAQYHRMLRVQSGATSFSTRARTLAFSAQQLMLLWWLCFIATLGNPTCTFDRGSRQAGLTVVNFDLQSAKMCMPGWLVHEHLSALEMPTHARVQSFVSSHSLRSRRRLSSTFACIS
jgi:hypothetical protein